MGLTRPIHIVAPKGTPREPELPRAGHRALLPRQRACRHGHEGARAMRARTGERRHRQSALSSPSPASTRAATGCRWRSSKGATAADRAWTAWTRSTPFTPTRETTRSRTSSRICRSASAATSCAIRRRRKANGAAASAPIREFAFLSDGAFSVEGEGHKYRPWGFDGGERTARHALPRRCAPPRVDEGPLPSKVPYRGASCGDRLVAVGPNGGGYGDPLERDPEAVLSDMLDGYISAETGASGLWRRHPRQGLDAAATDALRASAAAAK